MTETTRIASAGNVFPGALECLQRLGFIVSLSRNRQWQATSAECVLIADDPLALLGLAKFYELRGNDWLPTDAEIEAYLALDDDTVP